MDGFRALAHVRRHRCELVSRNRLTFKQWPHLAEQTAHAVRAHSAVLDGEICCLAPDGRSNFYDLDVPARVAVLSDVPIAARVPVATFRPNPSQRRAVKRNQGEVTVRVERLLFRGPGWTFGGGSIVMGMRRRAGRQ